MLHLGTHNLLILRLLYEFQAMSRIAVKGTSEENSEELAERIFSQLDTDHNGVITKEEFIDGCMEDEALCNLLAIRPF